MASHRTALVGTSSNGSGSLYGVTLNIVYFSLRKLLAVSTTVAHPLHTQWRLTMNEMITVISKKNQIEQFLMCRPVNAF